MKSHYNIVVDSITAGYSVSNGYNKVISELSFSVPWSNVFSVLGTNGSGKSTLLSAIAGLIHPLSGSVNIEPVTLNHYANKPTIAFLHQDYRLTNYPWASVMENITFPLRFQGIDSNQRYRRGQEVLKQIIPEIDPRKRSWELSGGQQQLLALSRAIVSEPDVLIADEPLSAADSIRGMKAIHAIQKVWESNKIPMIWVSHNIDEAILLGDTIGLLSGKNRGFDLILENPLKRPRNFHDLERPEITRLKARIFDFLLSDNEANKRTHK